MGRIAYVNGRFVPKAEAFVHIEDRGYQLADAVYEVWALFDGKLADPEGHFARLERSLSDPRKLRSLLRGDVCHAARAAHGLESQPPGGEPVARGVEEERGLDRLHLERAPVGTTPAQRCNEPDRRSWSSMRSMR